jgi:hypothetical protein
MPLLQLLNQPGVVLLLLLPAPWPIQIQAFRQQGTVICPQNHAAICTHDNHGLLRAVNRQMKRELLEHWLLIGSIF